MTTVQAYFLGMIQGLAEFLPISSSGHLMLAERFFGNTDIPIIFDILLHVATLGAVCIVFNKPIIRLFMVLWRFIICKSTAEDSGDLKLIVALLISTVVTGVIGMLIKDIVRQKQIGLIAAGFIATGCLLLIAEHIQSQQGFSHTIPRLFHAVIIGAAQGVGVLPGISRSGSTISAALLTGLDREKAGEYSFLLSIPAILAAFIFELKDADTLSSSVDVIPLIVGMVTAFGIGLFSLIGLLKLIKKGKLSLFAYYLIPLGCLLLML